MSRFPLGGSETFILFQKVSVSAQFRSAYLQCNQILCPVKKKKISGKHTKRPEELQNHVFIIFSSEFTQMYRGCLDDRE